MNDKKPMIRHCKNCQWCGGYYGGLREDVVCKVKYKGIDNEWQRLVALMCWHYKKRTDDNEKN